MANSFIGRSDLPPGIRNNNPGNLRPEDNWQGMVGTAGGFIVFKDVSWGLRALATDLVNKNKRGLQTITQIISAYAPASDNNNVPAYIAAVSNYTGIGPTEVFFMDTPTLHSLMRAIVDHENGIAGQLITDDDIDQGIGMVSENIVQWLQGTGITAVTVLQDSTVTPWVVGAGLAVLLYYLLK